MDSTTSSGESDRLTVAIALGATYFAAALNVDAIIGKEATGLLQLLRPALIVYFGFVSLEWVLYLLYKARSLRYRTSDADIRASDVTVCLIYLFAKLGRRKTILQLTREEREEWFNRKAAAMHTFYFDDAIELSFWGARFVVILLVFRHYSLFLKRSLGLGEFTTFVATAVVLALVWAGLSFLANVGRFAITGKQ